MGAWGRGASGGMSQSMIGGGGGSGSSQDTRSNRYTLLDDDSGASMAPEGGKAPFGGRSSLGGPPHSMGGGAGRQDYRTMSGATKSALFTSKDSDRDRSLDSSVRPPNPGELKLLVVPPLFTRCSRTDRRKWWKKILLPEHRDGLSSSTGLKRCW